MNTALPEFLRAIAAEPFVLGRSDCMTWLADWVMHARNVADPMAGLRGSYSTEAEWRAMVGADLVSFVDRIAGNCGIWRTVDEVAGDIGVVRIHSIEMGAIMGRRGWIVRAGFSSGAPGIGLAPNATAVMAWRV